MKKCFSGRVAVVAVGAFLFTQNVLAAINQDQIATKSPIKKSKINENFLIGHNVTPTAATPAKNTYTVGTYAAGVGLTNKIFVATSPWIWTSYNTANIHLKYIEPITHRFRVGGFASYFESYDSAPFLTEDRTNVHSSSGTTTANVANTNRYQWKSASAHFLGSYDVSNAVTTNVNFHYGYFFNDDFAYSIRMDPGRDSIRGQMDLTTLTSIKIPDSDVKLLFEFGTLGLNYMYPYLQVGSSIAYADGDWLFQLGASYTVAWNEARYRSGWVPGRYDSRVHYTRDGQAYSERYLQTAMHPEIQLQYLF